jgi:hypothetical protein
MIQGFMSKTRTALNARAEHAKYELRDDDRADFPVGLAGAFPHF